MSVRIHCVPVCAGLCKCVPIHVHVLIWACVVCMLMSPAVQPGGGDLTHPRAAGTCQCFLIFYILCFALNLNRLSPLLSQYLAAFLM